MKSVLLATFIFISGFLSAQINIAIEDFETTPSSPAFNFSHSGNGSVSNGHSSSSANPSNASFGFSGSRAFQVMGGTSIHTSASLNTIGYNYVTLRLRVMAIAVAPLFGLGGLDNNDYVRVEISTDNGLTWANTVEVRGNNGASWSYSAMGHASLNYDGNPSPVIFSPAGGGPRTTDGYSTITINYLPKSSQFRVRISLYNNYSGFLETPERWVIDQLQLLGTFEGPLPVKIGEIKAFEKNNGVQLDWTSYSEENVDRYVIERSANGIDFTGIGTLTALNSSDRIQYGFFDPSPVAGMNFYRLKNIDLDNKTGYSNIIRINLDRDQTNISLYPNPVTNEQVYIQSSSLEKGNYTMNIYNITGQPVYSLRFSHTGGSITQMVRLPAGMRPGLYSIRVDSESSRILSKRFMVQ